MNAVWVPAALALALAALGCGDQLAGPIDAAPAETAVDAAPLAFTTAPTFVLGPNPRGPLTGRLSLAANRVVRVTLAITDAERAFSVTRPALSATHELPVLGFRPATSHTLVVTITDEDGATLSSAPIAVTTPALPAGFPTFSAFRIVPAQIEPGITLTASLHWLIALDDHGRVVWFVDTVREATDLRRLANGNLLLNYRDFDAAAELDVYGNDVRRWHAANRFTGTTGSVPVALDSIHHETAVLGNGDLLVLGTAVRSYPSYPTSETDPTPRAGLTPLVDDVVARYRPDGTLVHAWSLLDRLDPYRVGYGSFSNFWFQFYAPTNAFDWAHANAVSAHPDGGYLVSMRHQDAVIKLDATGALTWILGTHDNWGAAFTSKLLAPVGTPFAWPFHQHAPKTLPNGNILVFDNGNLRVSPPTTPPSINYSRAVEYAVDPVLMQVRQVWEYDASQSIFASATGDADLGPATGNVIVTFGNARRIIEVTHTEPPVVVFELSSSSPYYRSERVPLYPPD